MMVRSRAEERKSVLKLLNWPSGEPTTPYSGPARPGKNSTAALAGGKSALPPKAVASQASLTLLPDFGIQAGEVGAGGGAEVAPAVRHAHVVRLPLALRQQRGPARGVRLLRGGARAVGGVKGGDRRGEARRLPPRLSKQCETTRHTLRVSVLGRTLRAPWRCGHKRAVGALRTSSAAGRRRHWRRRWRHGSFRRAWLPGFTCTLYTNSNSALAVAANRSKHSITEALAIILSLRQRNK